MEISSSSIHYVGYVEVIFKNFAHIQCFRQIFFSLRMFTDAIFDIITYNDEIFIFALLCISVFIPAFFMANCFFFFFSSSVHNVLIHKSVKQIEYTLRDLTVQDVDYEVVHRKIRHLLYN